MAKKTNSRKYAELRAHYDAGRYDKILAMPENDLEESAITELRAAAYAAIGEEERAIPLFETLAKRDPRNPTILLNLSHLFSVSNQHSKAIDHLQKANKIAPGDAEIELRLATVNSLAGRKAEARVVFEGAIERHPDSIKLLHAFAKFLGETSEFDQSRSTYEKMPPESLDDAEIANDYAFTLAACGEHDKAVEHFRVSVKLNPDLLINKFNLGKSLIGIGQYLEALDVSSSLLSEETEIFSRQDLLMDIALSLQRMGRYGDSLEVATQGSKDYPSDGMLALQKATMALAIEANKTNWSQYLSRHQFARTGKLDGHLCPVWQGQDFGGKSLLIWSEQSFGDQLIFLCALTQICEAAKEVTLIVHDRMTALVEYYLAEFRNCFVVTWEEASSPEQHGLISREFSYQMYLGDPWAYFWDEHKVDQGFSGLSIPPTLLQEFIAQVGDAKGPKIGVSWFSSPDVAGKSTRNSDESRNSLALSDLTILMRGVPAKWFNLQYGVSTEELAEAGEVIERLITVGPFAADGDFLHYGAQLSCMDLVISMDSTAAVFAACLGKETWVLCPNDPSWFWTINEQRHFCKNVSLFIKPWNLSWADFIHLEVAPRLGVWLKNKNWMG